MLGRCVAWKKSPSSSWASWPPVLQYYYSIIYIIIISSAPSCQFFNFFLLGRYSALALSETTYLPIPGPSSDFDMHPPPKKPGIASGSRRGGWKAARKLIFKEESRAARASRKERVRQDVWYGVGTKGSHATHTCKYLPFSLSLCWKYFISMAGCLFRLVVKTLRTSGHCPLL